MMRAPFASPPRHRAFLLLEVLVSLGILALLLTTVLRSFTTSLKAARRSSQITIATMLGRSLVEGWEMEPPPLGESQGDFGEAFDDFYYRVVYDQEVLDYEDTGELTDVGRMAYLRRVSVDIYFLPDTKRRPKPRRLLHFESALTSAEKFTRESRFAYELGFSD